MGDLIDVDTGAMRTHAGRVRGLVGKADQADDAARQVSFKPEMYGVIGATLVYPFLAPLELAGTAATAAVSGSLTATAEAVDALADGFDAVETAVETAMDTIRKELG